MHRIIGNESTARRRPKAVSWYQPQPHLELSLKLIDRAAPDFSASIIDVGGGESTNVTVLDVSRTAIDVSKKRLGEASEHVTWLVVQALSAFGYSSAVQRDLDHGRVILRHPTWSQAIVESVSRVGARALVSTRRKPAPESEHGSLT